MEDNYLKLFGNMFYNIKEDQDNKKIIEEASEVLASIIIKYGELINEITARTSAQDEFAMMELARTLLGQIIQLSY